MMKASELLQKLWNDIRKEGNSSPGYYYRRVALGVGLPAYAGIVCPGEHRRISLMAETGVLREISLRDITKGYTVEVEASAEGHGAKAFINITETSPSNTTIFTIVCTDILNQWLQEDNPEMAVKAVHQRLHHWHRFFQRESEGLSREEYTGLYGELSFLEALLSSGADPLCSVQAWKGPLGSNQDFLSGPVAVEIKCSTGNEVDRIMITNELQLDSSGLDLLFLYHCVYYFHEKTGRTLKHLVSSLSDQLGALSEEARLLFEDRLISSGYIREIPSSYDDWGFSERKIESFEVRKGFPRIVQPELSNGIVKVTYHIDLAACQQFKADNEAIINSLKGKMFHGQ